MITALIVIMGIALVRSLLLIYEQKQDIKYLRERLLNANDKAVKYKGELTSITDAINSICKASTTRRKK